MPSHPQTDLPDAVPGPTVRNIRAALEKADVIYIAFARVRRALLFDLREGGDHPPAVLVANFEVTSESQLDEVQRLRPGSATTGRFVSASWGRSTRAFIEQGVFPALLNRLPASAVSEAMAAFEQIREAERGSGGAGVAAPQ